MYLLKPIATVNYFPCKPSNGLVPKCKHYCTTVLNDIVCSGKGNVDESKRISASNLKHCSKILTNCMVALNQEFSV